MSFKPCLFAGRLCSETTNRGEITVTKTFLSGLDLCIYHASRISFTNALKRNFVPRLFLRGRKDPGRSWSRDAYKIDCLRGYGQSVKLHMLPLPDFALPLQGVSVLYNRI